MNKMMTMIIYIVSALHLVSACANQQPKAVQPLSEKQAKQQLEKFSYCLEQESKAKGGKICGAYMHDSYLAEAIDCFKDGKMISSYISYRTKAKKNIYSQNFEFKCPSRMLMYATLKPRNNGKYYVHSIGEIMY